MQLTHYNTNFQQRTFPIILVTDNVVSPSNLGSLLRLSDAFGIEKLVLCGTDVMISRKTLRTSRATEKTVNFELQDDVNQVIEHYKRNNYQIITLEITQNSHPLQSYTFKTDKPIVLVIGNENFGVSEPVLAHSDQVVHIQMFGKNSSMNVAQAANVALYEITKQLI